MEREQLEQIGKQYAKDSLMCPPEIVYNVPGGMASINVHLCVADAYVQGFKDGQSSPAEWHKIPDVLPPQGTAVLCWSESEGLTIAVLVGDFFYNDGEGIKVFPTHWIHQSKALKLPNEQ